MTKDQSDDPRPDRPTRQRLAARVDAIALDVSSARLRLRALAPCFESDSSGFDQLYYELDGLAGSLVDLAAGVRFGDVPLAAKYIDDGRGKRPVLDVIESRGVSPEPGPAIREPVPIIPEPAGPRPELLPNGLRELSPPADEKPAPPRPRPRPAPRPVGPQRPAAATNGHAADWREASVEDLGLPRRIWRELKRAGWKTAGAIDLGQVRAKTSPFVEADQVNIANALKWEQEDPGRGKRVSRAIELTAPKRRKREAEPANGAPTPGPAAERTEAPAAERPKGGTYTREQLGITEAIERLQGLNSCGSVGWGGKKPGELGGIVTVRGFPYAVLSASYGPRRGRKEELGAGLFPLYPDEEWTGPREQKVGRPEGHYFGAPAMFKGKLYRLGSAEDELNVTAVEVDEPPPTAAAHRWQDVPVADLALPDALRTLARKYGHETAGAIDEWLARKGKGAIRAKGHRERYAVAIAKVKDTFRPTLSGGVPKVLAPPVAQCSDDLPWRERSLYVLDAPSTVLKHVMSASHRPLLKTVGALDDFWRYHNRLKPAPAESLADATGITLAEARKVWDAFTAYTIEEQELAAPDDAAPPAADWRARTVAELERFPQRVERELNRAGIVTLGDLANALGSGWGAHLADDDQELLAVAVDDASGGTWLATPPHDPAGRAIGDLDVALPADRTPAAPGTLRVGGKDVPIGTSRTFDDEEPKKKRAPAQPTTLEVKLLRPMPGAGKNASEIVSIGTIEATRATAQRIAREKFPQLKDVPRDKLRFEVAIDPMRAAPPAESGPANTTLRLYNFYRRIGGGPFKLDDRINAISADGAIPELLKRRPELRGRVFVVVRDGGDPARPEKTFGPEDVLLAVSARLLDLSPAAADEFARANLLDCGLDVPDLVVDSLHAFGLKTVDKVLEHVIDNGNALASIAGINESRAKLFAEALYAHFDAWASLQAPRAPAAKKGRTKRKEAKV